MGYSYVCFKIEFIMKNVWVNFVLDDQSLKQSLSNSAAAGILLSIAADIFPFIIVDDPVCHFPPSSWTVLPGSEVLFRFLPLFQGVNVLVVNIITVFYTFNTCANLLDCCSCSRCFRCSVSNSSSAKSFKLLHRCFCNIHQSKLL